ncbi:MAG: peptidoglycan bridge formation glycyltransferase FemA/FemB family protein [Alcaligenes sp.]|nr:peptidoglycan bridge formation glycyltransferase FemA/FemB family protein [Alcaligenes sp.]
MVIWEQYRGPADDWDGHVASLVGGFYQTYGWGEVRRVAGWQPLRLLARRGGEVVAAASVLVKRKLGLAVCWVPGGPVGASKELDGEFRAALGSALGTKLFYCRISLLRADLENEAAFLLADGWQRPKVPMSSGLTMSYALAGDEAARLNRTSGNWRHNLKRSGRYGLRIEHWKTPDLEAISALYREMESLKSLSEQHSAAELAAIFTQCREKVAVYRCLDGEGRLLAVRAAGLCGAMALDLLAVAGAEARKVYASHATLWALIGHCSKLGLREYDLGGVDPVSNKGVYDFKHGTGANLIEYLGEWEWASVPGLRHVLTWLMMRKLA